GRRAPLRSLSDTPDRTPGWSPACGTAVRHWPAPAGAAGSCPPTMPRRPAPPATAPGLLLGRAPPGTPPLPPPTYSPAQTPRGVERVPARPPLGGRSSRPWRAVGSDAAPACPVHPLVTAQAGAPAAPA